MTKIEQVTKKYTNPDYETIVEIQSPEFKPSKKDHYEDDREERVEAVKAMLKERLTRNNLIQSSSSASLAPLERTSPMPHLKFTEADQVHFNTIDMKPKKRDCQTLLTGLILNPPDRMGQLPKLPQGGKNMMPREEYT